MNHQQMGAQIARDFMRSAVIGPRDAGFSPPETMVLIEGAIAAALLAIERLTGTPAEVGAGLLAARVPERIAEARAKAASEGVDFRSPLQ